MMSEVIPGMGHFNALFLITAGWGIFVTIFWMVCAWRAMSAHEKIADAIERIASGKQNE